MEDEGYFAALVRTCDQALVTAMSLVPTEQKTMLSRLDAVRSKTAVVGWGVKDAMDELWVEHVFAE